MINNWVWWCIAESDSKNETNDNLVSMIWKCSRFKKMCKTDTTDINIENFCIEFQRMMMNVLKKNTMKKLKRIRFTFSMF